MRRLIQQNIFKSPADIFIHKIDKIRLSPSSFIILNDSELNFLLTHYGSLESYFQVMSLDIMEGF